MLLYNNAEYGLMDILFQKKIHFNSENASYSYCYAIII